MNVINHIKSSFIKPIFPFVHFMPVYICAGGVYVHGAHVWHIVTHAYGGQVTTSGVIHLL